jgi:uncharacterized protein YndB with AHSA1/START domain
LAKAQAKFSALGKLFSLPFYTRQTLFLDLSYKCSDENFDKSANKEQAIMNNEAKQIDLVISRVFDASVEELWKAWTDGAYLMRWWGPVGFTCPVANIDLREGGKSLVGMSSPQFGDSYSIWHYQKIVPMSNIEFIHNLADKDGNKIDPAQIGMPPDFPQDQLQTISFKSLGDNKTELTVVEYAWTVGQMLEMSKMGMEQCLDKLEAVLKLSQ